MPPFDNKRELTDGDREHEPLPASLPGESPYDDMEELATDESEDEFAVLDDEEMKEFAVADWQGEYPDYGATEMEEKILERPRRWMAPVASCMMGTLLGAAFAGLIVNGVPRSQQASKFFVFLLILAPLLSFAWHWLFHLRPDRVMKRLKEEEANPAGPKPIHPE